jgi:hypothetical protein
VTIVVGMTTKTTGFTRGGKERVCNVTHGSAARSKAAGAARHADEAPGAGATTSAKTTISAITDATTAPAAETTITALWTVAKAKTKKVITGTASAATVTHCVVTVIRFIATIAAAAKSVRATEPTCILGLTIAARKNRAAAAPTTTGRIIGIAAGQRATATIATRTAATASIKAGTSISAAPE